MAAYHRWMTKNVMRPEMFLRISPAVDDKGGTQLKEHADRHQLDVCLRADFGCSTEASVKALHTSLFFGFCMVLQGSAQAAPITISFETLSDGTFVESAFPGLTFTNALVLTAEVSFNEEELPPKSGVNVASDAGGQMQIEFATPVASVGGFFPPRGNVRAVGRCAWQRCCGLAAGRLSVDN